MARSSKQSRSRVSSGLATASAALAALVPSGSTVKAIALTAVWCAAVGGVVYGASRGLPKLRAYAESKATIDPAAVRITFSHAPAWMPAETLQSLADASHQAMANASPLETEALQRVHQELLASGWFTRVEQVRRIATDEISVTAEFRTPYAMVRWNDEDHLIDQQGRRLPLSYTGDGARPRLPLILGVSMPKPAETGVIWLGSDLRAALNLTSLLRDRIWFANGQVKAIDTARYASEGIVELVTDRDTRIVWGGDPNDRSLGEMPADRKLAALDAMYQVSKRVDNGSGRTIDIRFDVVTLAPAPDSSSSAAEMPDVPSSLTAAAH